MKKLFFLIIPILLTMPSFGQKKGNLSDFYWLVGTWKNTKSGNYESWQYDQHSEYLSGKGYKVVNGDTTVTEVLAIEYQKGSFYYMADVPHNSNPVLFKISSKEKESFTASNPKHDFPKTISYQAKGRKKILATIGDTDRQIDFSFERIE